jgi:hypothetical protein
MGSSKIRLLLLNFDSKRDEMRRFTGQKVLEL